MSFELISKSPRKGVLSIRDKKIVTPFFMPVATKAVGKNIASDDYKDLGGGVRARAIICNSLILHFKPGDDVVKKMGGVHKFMNFDGVIFTDCGGFQASRNFFLGKTKNALLFKDPFSGKKLRLTPKKAMEIQHNIGSDVCMMLDDMAPLGASYEEAREAMENTHKWAVLSLKYHKELESKRKTGQKIFGIVQGNFFEDLRRESAEFISSLDFDGFAIGGVAIGETQEKMLDVVKAVLPYLPKDKPVYVMGVGKPEDVEALIELGVDCFDSVYPTMLARHSTMLTNEGRIYINKGRYSLDEGPIEEGCGCHTCLNYSRAYINHLSKLNDPTGHRLKSIHNLWFMQKKFN